VHEFLLCFVRSTQFAHLTAGRDITEFRIILSFDPSFTSSLLSPNILLVTLCSKTLSLCCTLSVKEEVLVVCVGNRIYKWMVLSVQSRVHNLLINLCYINHNVYFNTLNLAVIFSDIIHC
jgi:hypothetical protein